MRIETIGRTYATLLIGHLGTRALSLVSLAIVARQLGPAGTGLLASAVTGVLFASVIINWGSDVLAIRRVAKDSTVTLPVFNELLSTRLCGSVLASGAMALILFSSPRGAGLVLPLVLSLFAYALRLDWLLLATGRERLIVMSSLGREVANCALLVVVLQQIPSAQAAAWCFCAAEWLWSTLTIMGTGAWREWGCVRPTSRALTRSYVTGWPVALMAGSSLAYNKADVLLVAALLGAQAAGFYSAAYSLIFGALGLSAVLSRSAYPELSRTDGAISESLLKLCSLAAIAGMALSIAIGYWSGPFMTLAFGEEYVQGQRPLELLAWVLGPAFSAGLLTHALIASGQQRKAAGIVLGGVAVNLGANLLLIPRMGIEGAAAAGILAEASVLGMTLVVLQRSGHLTEFLRSLGWIFLAGGVSRLVIPVFAPGASTVLGLVALILFLMMCLPIVLKSISFSEALVPAGAAND